MAPDFNGTNSGAVPGAKGRQVVEAFAAGVLGAWFAESSQGPRSHVEAPPVQAARANGGRVGRAIKMAVATLLVVAMSVLVAVLIMEAVLEGASERQRAVIKWGTSGLTVLMMVTAARDVILGGRRLLVYVDRGAGADPWEELVKLGAISLTVWVSVLAWLLAPESPEEAPITNLTRPSLLIVGETREEHYPFLFRLADGPPDWSRGVQLNEGQISDVKALVASLEACVGSSGNQDVVVRVVGYADANEFRSAEGVALSSRELNRQAANRRAVALTEEIRKNVSPGGGQSRLLVQDPVEWPEWDPEAMTRSPRYKSARALRDSGGKDQGLFNRRAEVVVSRFGVCERLEIQGTR